MVEVFCYMIGDHVVHVYLSIDLLMDLYVLMIISLFLPHDVPVSDLYILMVLYAFVLVYLICSANVSFGTKVRPRILGKGSVIRR